MRYSRLFGKTQRAVSKEAQSVSHRLLTRAGLIDQVMAGVFSFLPLGLRVLEKIEKIVDEEMAKIGGQKILLSTLQPKEVWQKTQRWDNFDALLKVKSRFGKEYALGPTHEEVITPLAKNFISSYKDLPFFVYQIQTKFRDEPRAKSGIIRGREFGMKDLYSFHTSQKDLENYYAKVKEAYFKILERVGLKAKYTEASGGAFTKKYSHEFMVVSEAGEDTIVYCPRCEFCQEEEIAQYSVDDGCPKCGLGRLKSAKAIEVGNIFDLGTKFSQDFDLDFTDKDGKKKLVVMGCYGLGTTRLLGTIVEVHHDKRGIIWPESVAPYDVHLIQLKTQNSKLKTTTENLKLFGEKVYNELIKACVEVLYDDREDVSAGIKFADADLIGIPVRLVVSEKLFRDKKIEWKKRGSEKKEILSLDEVLSRIKA
jgi:prolyl-tRNA synthetase